MSSTLCLSIWANFIGLTCHLRPKWLFEYINYFKSEQVTLFSGVGLHSKVTVSDGSQQSVSV